VRTTVTIDDELLAQAKLIAARTNRTIGSVLEDALRKLIVEQQDPRRDPYELPDFEFARDGLRPGVDLLDKELMAELLDPPDRHALP
jgi:hypothetical protein